MTARVRTHDSVNRGDALCGLRELCDESPVLELRGLDHPDRARGFVRRPEETTARSTGIAPPLARDATER